MIKLIVDAEGAQPIYEQLKLQIKRQIISGELPPDTMLPSIRTLAKELKIGIITAKRAYDDLAEEGYTYAVLGKGIFVAHGDKQALAQAAEEKIKGKLSDCADFAIANGIEIGRVEELLEEVWKDKR